MFTVPLRGKVSKRDKIFRYVAKYSKYTKRPVPLGVIGLVLGLLLGLGGVYSGIMPNPEARAFEVNLENAGDEIGIMSITMENEINNKKGQINSLEITIGQLESVIQDNDEIIIELQDIRDILNDELVLVKNELNDELVLVKNERDVKQDKVVKLENRITLINQQLQAQLQVGLDLKERIDELVNEADNLDLQVDDLASKVSALQQDLDDKDAKLIEKQIEIGDLASKVSALQQELEAKN